MPFAGLARATDGDESSEQRNIIRPRLRCSWAVKSMEPRPDGAKAAGLAVAAPIFMAGAVEYLIHRTSSLNLNLKMHCGGCGHAARVIFIGVILLRFHAESPISLAEATLDAHAAARIVFLRPSVFCCFNCRKLSPAARAPNSRDREHGLSPAHDNDLESAYQEPLDFSSSPLQQLCLPVCLPLCTLSFSPTVA